jgi:hypothetical protein
MCYTMDATSEAEISRPLSFFAIAFRVLLRLLFWHFHTFGKEWRLVVTNKTFSLFNQMSYKSEFENHN